MDYLLASTEYDAFLQLMSDFNSMAQWDVACDEYGGLEGGGLEEGAGAAAAGGVEGAGEGHREREHYP